MNVHIHTRPMAVNSNARNVAVLPKVYRAISIVDVSTILQCSDAELRPILACLVRMSLIAPLDQSLMCMQGRTAVLQVRHFSYYSYKWDPPYHGSLKGEYHEFDSLSDSGELFTG